jgi:putrescine transport system ATP-binding protein
VIERREDDPPHAENALEGVVEDIAYLGDMSIYHVRLAGGGLARVARTNRIRGQTQTILWEDRCA